MAPVLGGYGAGFGTGSGRFCRLVKAGNRLRGLAGTAFVLLASFSAVGQPENPVYVDDSPVAAATFDSLPGLVGTGNLDEAARALQALLDTQGDRLVAHPVDAGVYISVRDAVHERLLGSDALLARYRELHAQRAARLLSEGDVATVERSLLLTPSGFEAVLQMAQSHLESARFEAARLALEQLEDHPDRAGDAAADAAALLAQAAGYLGREEVHARAEEWAHAAGATVPEMGAVEWPDQASRQARTPLEPTGQIAVSGVLSRPLWSQLLQVPEDRENARFVRNEGFPPNATQLWIFPAVVGEMLLIADGSTISAYNRYTLTPIWSQQPPFTAAPETPQRVIARARLSGSVGSTLEDPAIVSAAGRTAAAVIGRAVSNARDGDDRLHAIDLDTGRLRWSVNVTEAHPDLAGASIRGRPIITEGLVIVGARKYLVDRRLLSMYLVAFDEATGELAWKRLIGSAGSLPWSRMPAATHDGTLHEGIVYRSDRLGVIGAYEAVTGRPLWVRRLPADETGVTAPAWPWYVVAPIVHDGKLIVLTPSESEIVQLDAATGRQLAVRAAAHFGSPRYLTASGTHLVAVNESSLHVLPLGQFRDGTPRESQQFGGVHIRGRVVPAGGQAVVPVEDGVALVDLNDPAADPKMIDLDQPGNVLPDTDQLLVVDDTRVHSYLLWENAEQRLSEAMAQNPEDPAPAITLAELAFRAGRLGSVLPAADAAILAIAARPTAPEIDSERRRLFHVLHTVVTAGQEPGFDGRREDVERISDPVLLEEIINRLARIASSPDERVTHLLALGRHKEQVAEPVQAAGTYQRVLDDEQLAGAIWRGPNLSVRADLEAGRRIERLVNDYGPSVYAMQESEARARFDMLGADATEEALLDLAMQYPMATLTPRLWMEAADRRAAAGDGHGAVAALESGLSASSRILGVPDDVVAELTGRLTSTLLDQNRVGAAVRLLDEFARRRPGVAPTNRGQPLDLASLRSDLDRRLAAIHRWPKIGDQIQQQPQVLPSWVLLEPLFKDRRGEVNNCVVLENGDRVAIFAPRQDPAGPLEEIWSHATQGRASQALRLDADAVYMFLPTEDGGGIVEKVPLTDGAAGWRTTPLRKLLQTGAAAAGDPRNAQAETPLDGRVYMDDVIASMDDRTLVLTERNGRAAAIDLTTGEMLWSAPLMLDQVHDAVMGTGRLCVSGQRRTVDPAAPAGAPVTDEAHVVVVDARTGRVLQQHEAEGAGRARWVRVSEAGDLIVGFDRAIRSINLSRAQTNWTVRDEQVRNSRAAWAFADRLFILTGEDTLLLASLSDGRLRERPLDLLDATQQGLRRGRIDLFAAGPKHVVLAMPQGIIVYDQDGTVLGADAITELEAMLTASPASGRAVTMDIVAAGRRPDDNLIFMLHQLDTSGGMLLSSVPVALGAAPQRMTLMDERIIVSAGAVTVVYRAPVSEAEKTAGAPAAAAP